VLAGHELGDAALYRVGAAPRRSRARRRAVVGAAHAPGIAGEELALRRQDEALQREARADPVVGLAHARVRRVELGRRADELLDRPPCLAAIEARDHALGRVHREDAGEEGQLRKETPHGKPGFVVAGAWSHAVTSAFLKWLPGGGGGLP